MTKVTETNMTGMPMLLAIGEGRDVEPILLPYYATFSRFSTKWFVSLV